MGKIEISQQIYNDALKASGDEALAKEFALAYATLPNLAKRPTNDELLEVCKLRFFFSFLAHTNEDTSRSVSFCGCTVNISVRGPCISHVKFVTKRSTLFQSNTTLCLDDANFMILFYSSMLSLSRDSRTRHLRRRHRHRLGHSVRYVLRSLQQPDPSQDTAHNFFWREKRLSKERPSPN